jgi:hypothetical protein
VPSGIAINRATMSDEPPGEKVTIMRTGFEGQACALTKETKTESAASSAILFMAP